MPFKILLTICTILIYSSSSAQFKYSLKMGITQSYKKENLGLAGLNQEVILKSGFQMGVTIIVPLVSNFSFRPSLQFSQKGYKTIEKNAPPGTYYFNRNLSSSYVEVPLDIAYNLNKRNSIHILIGTGPVISYGLFGKMKSSLEYTSGGQFYSGNYIDNKIFKSRGSNRMDISWDFLVGLQYKRTSFNINYNYGLRSTIDDDWHYQKNRSFAFTIGYLIKNRIQ